jgi:hypothetical protein
LPDWPSYTWDPAARQYRDERGRFVPRSSVREALDGVIDAAISDAEDAARALQSGEISLIEWQLRVERATKRSVTAGTALATGGWAQTDSADWAAAGRRIRDQYGYLDSFAREIARGDQPLDGQFVQRTRQYANAGTLAYEATNHAIQSEAFSEHRRVLRPAEHCPDCVRYAEMGWIPIEEFLPDIGDREYVRCGGNDKCTYEFRLRREG